MVPESEAPIDLSRADQLYYEGAYEEALTIYTAAAERGDDTAKQEGLWAISLIQSRQGDNGAAERSVEAFRETAPPPERDRAALLLLGKAEFAQGDMEEARSAFEDYVETGGPAWPYAQLFLAQIAIVQGDAAGAVERIDQALLAGLPDAAATDALRQLGELYEQEDDPAAAIATYQRMIEFVGPGDSADALASLAASAENAGDTPTAIAALEEVVIEYPGSDAALNALGHHLLTTSTVVGTRERGIVLFRHRHNSEAETAFRSISDTGGPGAAEANYYLGIISERYELWDNAIAHYDTTINLLPPGANDWLRAQAWWDRATVLERLGRTAEAVTSYAAVVDALPAHEDADNGVFRAGLISYQAGLTADAATYWQRFLAVAPNAEERARANYWLAKTAEAAGDSAGATAYYQSAIEADPLDVYALRARAILTGTTEIPEPTDLAAPATDWAAAEAWLTSTAGAEDAVAREAVFKGEQWLRALELLEAGLDDRADDEFQSVLGAASGDSWLTYRLIRAISAFDRPWVTARSAVGLLAPGAPREILQLAYPLAYLELASEEAQSNGFSPLLLLALVRQESLYRPDAVSIAEAMGLTQVIPSTADGIAAELEVEDFRYSDLMRPRISLRFGAYYLGTLVEGFGGEIGPALAGYNGGPANAGDWWELGGGDQDLFLESIEFPETRAYVEFVLENYARYLYAYGFVEEPYLP